MCQSEHWETMSDTGESPLHSPLCSHRPTANLVLKVLLAHGAKPNCAAAKDSRDMHGDTPLYKKTEVSSATGGAGLNSL